MCLWPLGLRSQLIEVGGSIYKKTIYPGLLPLKDFHQLTNNNSCARHESVYYKMNTKNFFAGVAVAVVAVVGMCSFTTSKESANEFTGDLHAHTHVAVQGAHCNGTVGCSCSGFSPITNGEVWQQAYCKHCGHKRSVHK